MRRIVSVPYAGIARIRFDGLAKRLSARMGTPTDDQRVGNRIRNGKGRPCHGRTGPKRQENQGRRATARLDQPRAFLCHADEIGEQGGRIKRFGPQFGMALHADEPRMIGIFDHLGQPAIR